MRSVVSFQRFQLLARSRHHKTQDFHGSTLVPFNYFFIISSLSFIIISHERVFNPRLIVPLFMRTYRRQLAVGASCWLASRS